MGVEAVVGPFRICTVHCEEASPRDHHNDQGKDATDGAASEDQREQRGPEQIELLLHGKRPSVSEFILFPPNERSAPVHQIDGRHGYSFKGSGFWTRAHADLENHDEEKHGEGRPQSQDPSNVEIPVVDLACRGQLVGQQRCYQITAKDEENVHTCPRAGERRLPSVVKEDKDDRYGSEAIESGFIFQIFRSGNENDTSGACGDTPSS